MTKFTKALAVALAAAFVPFSKGICPPGELALGALGYSQGGGPAIAANDCGIITSKPGDPRDHCGDYPGGTKVLCSTSLNIEDPVGNLFHCDVYDFSGCTGSQGNFHNRYCCKPSV